VGRVLTVTHRGRTFDFRARLDPGNLPYRLQATVDLTGAARYWAPGVTLDQQAEGACVPHGVVGDALASPVRVRRTNAQALAFEGYDWCRRNDIYAGENYDGTDVNTGMKWGRLRGFWAGWRWAHNMRELRAGLEEGPVVLGLDWHEDMYEAPSGILHVNGDVVGGHCILATGYTPRHPVLKGPAWRLKNSWGPKWGTRGSAYIKAADLDRILFQAGGEAAVPVNRSTGKA
jgi:hypothetical protein